MQEEETPGAFLARQQNARFKNAWTWSGVTYFADNDRRKDKMIRKLNARVDEQKRTIRAQNDTNDSLKETIDRLEATIGRLQKKNKRMRTK